MSFLFEALRAHALRAPRELALEDGRGTGLTWQELAVAVEAQAAAFRKQLADLRRPVALLADRGIAQCVADLALMECGVPVLSLPLFFTAAQRAHALAQSGAQLVIRDREGTLEREWLSAAASAVIPAQTARISYTSGSTGAAKGICLAAAHLLAVASGVLEASPEAHGGRHLAILPPGVLLEDVAGCYAALLSGATCIVASQQQVGLEAPFQPDFARMAAAIETTRATSVILVPEYLAGLVAFLEHSGRRLPQLRLVAVGGARVPPQLLVRAREVGLPVRQGYGLTECGSVVTLHDGSPDGLGSVGRPLGTHAIRIARDGEIIIEGPLYLGTIGEPLPRGWRAASHATGDIGRLDAEGRLWIEGRKSNLIITSYGRNVSPEWIESLLLGQRDIAQAMVHGDGEARLSALVVPRGGRAADGIAAAIAAVNAMLPEYAWIARWRIARPFTAPNGELTGNGRLRRQQILANYPMEESADAVL